MKRNKILQGLTIAIGLAFGANAFAVDLYLWKPAPTMPRVVVIAKDGESPRDALDRYYETLRSRPYFHQVFPQGENRPTGEDLERIEFAAKAPLKERVLLLGNNGEDLYEGDKRIATWMQKFREQGEETFLFPTGMALSLAAEETADAYEKLERQFPFWNGMGGRDYDPSIYNAKNTYSYHTITELDRADLDVVAHGLKSERIVFSGTCRGGVQALCLASRELALSETERAVAKPNGNRLIQSIFFFVGRKVWHSGIGFGLAWPGHNIWIKPTTNNVFKRYFFPETDKLHVNTLHHQAADVDPTSGLEVSAAARDGVPEVIESKNGLAIAFQFHQELMNNSIGYRIMEGLVRYKRDAISSIQCRSAFQH